jgi:hypothetical protein
MVRRRSDPDRLEMDAVFPGDAEETLAFNRGRLSEDGFDVEQEGGRGEPTQLRFSRSDCSGFVVVKSFDGGTYGVIAVELDQ